MSLLEGWLAHLLMCASGFGERALHGGRVVWVDAGLHPPGSGQRWRHEPQKQGVLLPKRQSSLRSSPETPVQALR
ncbi:hypothetical protein AB9M62_08675 [Bacillales bacterium AN1005]